MYDAGARFGQINLFTLCEVCRCVLYQIVIGIPVNSQYNRGFQLTRGGLAAYKKTEPQLVSVIPRLGERGAEICIMYFTTFNMLAITPVGQHHK